MTKLLTFWNNRWNPAWIKRAFTQSILFSGFVDGETKSHISKGKSTQNCRANVLCWVNNQSIFILKHLVKSRHGTGRCILSACDLVGAVGLPGGLKGGSELRIERPRKPFRLSRLAIHRKSTFSGQTIFRCSVSYQPIVKRFTIHKTRFRARSNGIPHVAIFL
jgi:hypothetical protein